MMNLTTAKQLIETLAWLEAPCGALDTLLMELEGNEKEKYKNALGNILKSHFEMLMPIINKYPELDPDGEGAEYYNEVRNKHLPSHT